MTAKNITPAHLRCMGGACPSLHQLEDGRLLVVGVQIEPPVATLNDFANPEPFEEIAGKVGPDEAAIIISPALLDVYVAEKAEALLAENDRNQRDWHNGFQRVQGWLSERDWWTEDDIDHEGNDPAQTLINGLERKEREKAKSQWQSIETHDGSTKEVLGLNSKGDIRKIWYFAPSSLTKNWLTMDQKKWFPTHWMPLPLPPVSEG